MCVRVCVRVRVCVMTILINSLSLSSFAADLIMLGEFHKYVLNGEFV